jgi:hypothetical protein
MIYIPEDRAALTCPATWTRNNLVSINQCKHNHEHINLIRSD